MEHVAGQRVMALELVWTGMNRPRPANGSSRPARRTDGADCPSSNHSATVSSGADALAMPR